MKRFAHAGVEMVGDAAAFFVGKLSAGKSQNLIVSGAAHVGHEMNPVIKADHRHQPDAQARESTEPGSHDPSLAHRAGVL